MLVPSVRMQTISRDGPVTHLTPSSLDAALAALAREPVRIVAGGTDLMPALGERGPDRPLVDVARLPELGVLVRDGPSLRIGAAVTWTQLLRTPLPPAFDGLKAAAREVGSVQIQNVATLAGNLANASPAADGMPPLLALGAEVEVASLRRGRRRVALERFVTGVRRTVLEPDEMVSAIVVPAQPPGAAGAFAKLGARRYLVISIASAAVVVAADAARCVVAARVAVGACSPVAQRLPALEAALLGQPVARMADAVAPEHFAPLAPIDDVRGSAEYRCEAAATLVRRLLEGLRLPRPERVA